MSGRNRSDGPRTVAEVTALLLLGLLLVSCSGGQPAATEAYSPALVEAIDGSDLKQVTFTEDGAEQVSLEIVEATQNGRQTVVPYESLIYTPDGKVWVYTSPSGLTFVRTSISVDSIEDGQVLLSAGLSPGTRVVTVGAAEVYGAELDIAGH